MSHMETRLVIAHEARDVDAWICVCGNRPTCDGFYPCDQSGRQVEPDKAWIQPLYVCDRCGRIVNSETLEVVGERAEKPEATIQAV